MTTALFTHPDCLNHVTPLGHPEQVARIESILAALSAPEFDALQRIDAPKCRDEHILLAHTSRYLAAIQGAAPENGTVSLDADTHMSVGTLTAALRAVGGNIAAVDRVVAGKSRNAFIAMRPPGHHAEKETPMGFCLFGNVAIAAKYALESHGLKRVAIVDFDVHHGNGTQDLVWNDERIFFASTHQMPLFPGTGAASEKGAFGNVLNVPLSQGADGQIFRDKMQNEVLPAVEAHDPELVFVSAGFDAHRDDPLAGLNLEESDFVWATEQICDIASRKADGRVVSTLEGGYDLDALARCVAAHVKVLMGQTR